MVEAFEKAPQDIAGMRRAALFIGGLLLLAVVLGRFDLQPNLARVNVSVLSGSEGGNYYAVVARLAAKAKEDGGARGKCVPAELSTTSNGSR